MSNYPGQREVVFVHKESNTLGTAAFVLALVGFFSAGIFAPIALVMSIVALQRQPKDLAVAGLVLSLVTIPFALFLWTFMLFPMMVAAGLLMTGAVPLPEPPMSTPTKEVAKNKADVIDIDVRGARVMKDGKGYSLRMTLTNRGDEPLSKFAVDVEMVDYNKEIVAKDTLTTAMQPLMKNKSQPVELRVPLSSPLAADMPTTVVARVKIRKTGSAAYDEPADRRGIE